MREQRRVLAVRELDVAELDVALAVQEVDRTGRVDHVGRGVEHLEHPLRRRRRALGDHHEHADHHERHLEHHDVDVERRERAVAEVAFDHLVATEEQDHRQAHLRDDLHQRRELGLVVDLLDRDPTQPARGTVEEADLRVLGRERLHDADAGDVFLDDRRDVGHASKHHPRDREQPLPHPRAHDVERRQHQHRHQRELHVHVEHQDQRGDEAQPRDREHRTEPEEHLDGADVGVRARDELTALHRVVERERLPREVLEHHRAQLALHLDARALEAEPLRVPEQELAQAERDHREHVRAERLVVHRDRVVDRAAQHLRDRELEREHHDRRDHRADQHAPVRAEHRQQAADPALALVGVDPRRRRAERGGRRGRRERRVVERGALRVGRDRHAVRLSNCSSP